MYKPTAVDIAFARQVTRIVRFGGVWGLPEAQLIYRFGNHQMVLISPSPADLDEQQKDTHERTRVVFGAIGWTVKP